MKKHFSNNHNKVLSFLSNRQLAVIATTDQINPYPESALIAFAHNDNLELFFQTNQYSRKAVNLQRNLHASFVIGLDQDGLGTVQYQGIAKQVREPEVIAQIKQRFIAKDSPTAKPKYLENPDNIFFVVTPVWIGFYDYSGGKVVVLELTQF